MQCYGCSLESSKRIKIDCDSLIKKVYKDNKNLIENTELFCEGYFDGISRDTAVYLILGLPINLDACFYCDAIEQDVPIEFLGTEELPDLSKADYVLGFNSAIIQKFELSPIESRSDDQKYFRIENISENINEQIEINWRSDSISLRINKNSFLSNFDNLNTGIYLDNDLKFEVPFSELYQGISYPCNNERSVGLNIIMDEFTNKHYCHFYDKKYDIVSCYFIRQQDVPPQE